MEKPIPTHLRLVTAAVEEFEPDAPGDLDLLLNVCQAFDAALGWPLTYMAGPPAPQNTTLLWSAPVNPGVGASPGLLGIVSNCDALRAPDSALATDTPPSSAQDDVQLRSNQRIPLAAAADLAGAVGNLWGELLATRQALAEREAELAAGVPVTHRNDQESPLADRLTAVLKAGAEAVDVQAAALYLLDEATSELKLRACWGLPQRRLCEPARPLRGALADLEALLGHAVVLSDPMMFEHWKAPLKFGSAVCLPVSSATMPLGTVWFFGRRPRDFSDAQTNVLEVVAGRVAADLEREMLLEESLATRHSLRQFHQAEQCRAESLPSIAPAIEGWSVAGCAAQAHGLGGAWFDWFDAGSGVLAALVGAAHGGGAPGALVAAEMRGALRAQTGNLESAAVALDRANNVLWSGSANQAGANLGLVSIASDQGQLQITAAGSVGTMVISARESRWLCAAAEPLGTVDPLTPEVLEAEIPPGGALVLLVGAGSQAEDCWPAEFDARLAAFLQPRMDESAASLAAATMSAWNELASSAQLAEGPLRLAAGSAARQFDRAVLVIRRNNRR